MKNANTFSQGCFRFIKWLVWLFYPKMQIQGEENLPEEPSIIVANHCQIHGPVSIGLYYPRRQYTWCAGQMMHLKDVPQYAYQDFWSGKSKYTRWFYRALSYLIAPLSVCVFNSADTIGVYRDTRIIKTFKETVSRLEEGADVVIFPEHNRPHNQILCDFQDRFIDVAKLYYKRTGRQICFMPMYIAPNLGRMYIGKTIRFCSENAMEQERLRIKTYLMEQITQLAVSAPVHKVVPYPNVSKKKYPCNIPMEETIPNEASSC